MKRFIINILLVFFCVGFSFGQTYKNHTLHIEKRVDDLIERMTLAEKLAQLQSTHASRPRLDDKLFNNKKKLDSMYANGVGMINPAFDETMEETIARRNRLQDYLLNHTRLGIPVIFLDEAHHGLVQRKVDVFPHGIGIASSWDTVLVRKIYSSIAGQAASRGTSMVLSPVVDVVRDPRWGRTGECWGEDPYLNGMFGVAVVRGLQGSSNGLISPNHVAATLKHFTGHGQPESGNNTGPANYSIRALREYHMEPFRLTIAGAKPAGVMASYNEVDEIPSHANPWLLKAVLRGEWGFKGIVTSDWFGIDQMVTKHRFALDNKDAALKAFNAGVTVDLPYGLNYVNLVALVKEGKIPMKAIDSAVAKVLRLKFQMGLFEGKPISVDSALAYNKKTEGRELALKAAEKSMILLKNDNNLLPIKKGQYKKIAVIGPFGKVNLLGDYSGVPSRNVGIYQALKQRGVDVSFAQGVKVSANGDTVSQNNYQFIDALKPADAEENKNLIAEAVETAKKSDFIVLAIGENEQFSREAWDNHFGDMTTLDLQSGQQELVEAIARLGKPYVVYLMNGRPLSVNWIAENSPAIIEGWYTGEESGTAFANILFGDVNPSGKLTISVPRSVGQIPVNYNARPTSRYYEYATEKNTPLFPFGFGLSYTNFVYDAPVVSGMKVSVRISNTGKVIGDEVAQLYISQKSGSSVVRPVKELKGFQRISLAAGESRTVDFTLTPELLKHWSADMKYVIEPGKYEIMVGGNSTSTRSVMMDIK